MDCDVIGLSETGPRWHEEPNATAICDIGLVLSIFASFSIWGVELYVFFKSSDISNQWHKDGLVEEDANPVR